MAVIRRQWDASRVDGLWPSADDPSARRGNPDSQAPGGAHRSRLAAFVFADIRGFTRFTTTRGADAAAQLASRFIELASGVVTDHHGWFRGTWGDQVLAEFESARDAVRAAVELQERCGDATLADPSLPLAVGIGVDVGEPADSEVARTGGAVNLAARLCARAGNGEILTTPELVHLAGPVDSVRYQPRGKAALKGVGRVPVIRIRPTVVDGPRQAKLAALMTGASDRRRAQRRRAFIGGITAAALVAGAGAWWLTRGDGQPPEIPANSVGLIDTASGDLVGSVPVGQSPEGVVAGGGSWWVANTGGGTVSRIDPRTRAMVQTVTVGLSPVALAGLGNDIWVVNNGSGTVSVVSTETNQVVGTVTVGNQPSAIAAGYGAVWVTDQADASITRIDPHPDATGAYPSGTIPVGDSPDGIAVGQGAVWVSNRGDGTVSRVDPYAQSVTALVPVGTGPRGVVAAAGGVWVANSLDLTVSHINPATNQVDHVLPVGDSPDAIVEGAGSVWVSDSGDATIARIDRGTWQVARVWSVGGSPQGLALFGSVLAVVARPQPGDGHRGGILTVADSGGPFQTIDPAVDYGGAYYFTHLVYDGLVANNHSAGEAGYELVPDLAYTIPAPTNNGTTYTFTLRAGIRYSNGTPLLASDFRRGIEREFTAFNPNMGGMPDYYTGIVGGNACKAAPSSCNLRQGIVTNNSAGTVTFHLMSPDPDFIGKLSLLFATPAPLGSPRHDVGLRPLLGTGPYAISNYHANGTFTLIRNPYFHQWSSAAQPAGYPNEIRWTQYKTEREALAAVERGDADVAFPEARDLAFLRATYPEQLKADIAANATQMVVLNPLAPPFNSVLARQAVAFALTNDPKMAAIFAGGPTCSLVPSGYPGHSPGCLYRPSLDAARARVRASGTSTDRVLIYVYAGGVFPSAAQHVVDVLQLIGYRRARIVAEPNYQLSLYNPRTRPMNGEMLQWTPDFPSTAQFYTPLLSCQPGAELPFLCDRHFDALASRAAQIQTTDPGQGQRLWRALYKEIDADALVVPTNAQYLSGRVLLSTRVGDFGSNPFFGPILDQLWVR